VKHRHRPTFDASTSARSCSAGGIGKVGAGENERAHGRDSRSRRDLDPRFLDRVYKVPRGRAWIIETWNRDDWVARLLGRHWHEYSPPSVLHWFNPDGLRRLVNFIPIEKALKSTVDGSIDDLEKAFTQYCVKR
jgi:hypothetical protein